MTQHEILKKHTDKYCSLRIINQAVIEQIEKSVGEAAEEYAKQEAINFYITLPRNMNSLTLDKLWERYQLSKTK